MRPNLLGRRIPPKPTAAVGQAAPAAASGPPLLPLLVLAGIGYYMVKNKRPNAEDQLVEMQRKSLAAHDRGSVGWWAVGYGSPGAKRFKAREGPFASKAEAERAAEVMDKTGWYTEVAWGGQTTGDKEPLREVPRYGEDED